MNFLRYHMKNINVLNNKSKKRCKINIKKKRKCWCLCFLNTVTVKMNIIMLVINNAISPHKERGWRICVSNTKTASSTPSILSTFSFLTLFVLTSFSIPCVDYKACLYEVCALPVFSVFCPWAGLCFDTPLWSTPPHAAANQEGRRRAWPLNLLSLL